LGLCRFLVCLLHGILFRGVTRTEYLEVITMDNVTVFSYNSTTRSRVPLPDWLKNHDGKQHWKDNNTIAILNQNNMAKAMEVVSQHINQTGGKARNHILSHHATVLNVVLCRAILQISIKNPFLPRIWPLWSTPRWTKSGFFDTCMQWQRIYDFQYVEQSLGRHYSSSGCLQEGTGKETFHFVTCHVTGFYPWEVQVEWQKDGWLPLVEGVTSGEVLPNGDGTLQLKKTLTISGGNQRCVTIQSYTCLVQHSSLSQNITRTWAPNRDCTTAMTVGGLSLAILGVVVIVGKYR
uniref:Ig-like domain-containing protein n=1 Tax=Paramormyrops kingsleyae TaxID=1676925 RepID=A0A3B3RKE2_9TELE